MAFSTPPTPEEIDAFLWKTLAAPASIEVDGKRVVNRSAEDLLTLAGAAGGKTAKANNVLHISRCSPGGSPVD